uniref:Amiloride-sensitive sodium channel subunit alpha-like n=1 Tax=Saccoglossus kowalevskii TaxID=10224 RepID=A0ABM0GPP6_SACKO
MLSEMTSFSGDDAIHTTAMLRQEGVSVKPVTEFTRKHNTYFELFARFSESTTCHGLPRIIGAKSMFGKVIWSAVCITALTVFVWQASDLIKLFLAYDVRVKIEVGTALSLPFPAVTLCNTNKLRLTAIERSEHNMLARTDPQHPDTIHRLLSYESSCGEGEFNCGQAGLYGNCIHNSKRCDGVHHCLGGEDEQDCISCTAGLKCDFGINNSNGKCIPRSSVCDHYPDCQDGGDEQYCDY